MAILMFLNTFLFSISLPLANMVMLIGFLEHYHEYEIFGILINFHLYVIDIACQLLVCIHSKTLLDSVAGKSVDNNSFNRNGFESLDEHLFD